MGYVTPAYARYLSHRVVQYAVRRLYSGRLYRRANDALHGPPAVAAQPSCYPRGYPDRDVNSSCDRTTAAACHILLQRPKSSRMAVPLGILVGTGDGSHPPAVAS